LRKNRGWNQGTLDNNGYSIAWATPRIVMTCLECIGHV
jgi:hypothetical protein